jgi:uncharacterized protein with LGFP repeats
VVTRRRRRRAEREEPSDGPQRAVETGYETGYETGFETDYESAPDRPWGHDDTEVAAEHSLLGSERHPDGGPAARVGWRHGETAGEETDRFDDGFGAEGEDPDAVDTDSIPVASEAPVRETGHDEGAYPGGEHSEQASYTEGGYPEDEYPLAEAAGTYAETVEAGYPEAEYPVGETGRAEGYRDVAVLHGAADLATPVAAAPDAQVAEAVIPAAGFDAGPSGGRHAAAGTADAAPDGTHRPTIHLPLDDPYQVPEGYPIKANASFGLYYTPGSALYHDTLAEIWLSSEEVAQANGFVKAD